jgi:hypothetical protein
MSNPGTYTDAKSSLTGELKVKLVQYQEKIQAEIAGAKQRSLEIHNTTREAYIHQDDLITELLESLEEGEEIVD